jgi:hypothetical protein
MTPADIISEARKLLQDTRTPFRYSDNDLLGYLRQALTRMLNMRPDLFTAIAPVPLQAGTVVQKLPADAHRLVDIYHVVGGNAVTEIERPVFERSHPNWAQDPAGVPVNYMRHPRNPTSFFVYPQPLEGVSVMAEYAAVPTVAGIDDQLPQPSSGYIGALVDGVVFLASSIDDEHVQTGRAQLFRDSFMQVLGVDLQSRVVVDEDQIPPPPREDRRTR